MGINETHLGVAPHPLSCSIRWDVVHYLNQSLKPTDKYAIAHSNGKEEEALKHRLVSFRRQI